MSDIDLKFKAADSGRQLREAEKSMISRKRVALLAQAERESFSFLRALGCEDIKLHTPTQANLEFDRGFDGDISLTFKAFKGGEIEIPIKLAVKSDALTFPPKEDITKMFLQATVKDNTIESDKPDVFQSMVASKNLEIIAKEKEQFSRIAESQVINLLRNLNYGDVKLAGQVEVNMGRNEDKTYTGTITVPMHLADKYGEKNIDIPVDFKGSILQMPDSLIVQKVVAETQSVQEEVEEATDKEVDSNVQKIDEEVQHDEEETLKALELGPSSAAASQEPKIEKQAQGNNSVHATEYAPVLFVNKVSLPDSLKVGDVICVGGAKYEVMTDHAEQLSTVGSGSTWTLRLVLDSDKEVTAESTY